MTLNAQQQKEFEEAARPLIAFINEHCHPHTTVLVTPTDAELVEGVCYVHCEDYLKDKRGGSCNSSE